MFKLAKWTDVNDLDGNTVNLSYIVPAAGDANTYATTTSDATAFPL